MTGTRSAVLVLAAVLGLLATACGSTDPQVAYCAVAQRDQSVFTDDGTGVSLVTNIAKLHEMAAVAPRDLTAPWQTFLTALEGLRAAIAKVGLKPRDFVHGVPPAGITASARLTIATAADRLGQDDVVAAAGAIEQEAKDVCKLQFGLS